MIRKGFLRVAAVSVTVMPNWSNGFPIKEGIAVTYTRATPEAGPAKLDARQVDFAAVDAPLTPEQASDPKIVELAKVGYAQALGLKTAAIENAAGARSMIGSL